MIVQCDQCNAKFRLDDSKVKDGGAKVRCSKCKHIFIVRKEAADEADVDSFLDGLVPSQPDTAREPASPAPSVGSGLDVAGVPSGMDGAGSSTPDSHHGTDDFDFGEFSFETAPVSAPAAEPAPFPDDGFDFDIPNQGTHHHLSPEPAPGESPALTDFSFDETARDPAPVASAVDSPVPYHATSDFDFDEFSLEEGMAAQAPTPDMTASPGEFDFSHQSVPLESDGDSSFPEPAKTEPVLDFGEFEFDGTSDFSNAPGKPVAGPGPDQDDLITSTPATHQPSSGETGPSATGSDDFFLGDDMSATAKAGIRTDESAIPFGEAELSAGTPTLETVKDFDFSSAPDLEFSFEPKVDLNPPVQAAPLEEHGSKPEPSLEFDDFYFAPASPPGAKETPDPFPGILASGTEKSGEMAHDPFSLSSDSEMPVFADEPPPLSISSRRKSSAILSIAVIAGLVILVIVMAVGGGYYFKEGPAVFNKLGLGFMTSLFGSETREEGKIAVRNTSALFMKNSAAGEIFVIKGEAVNNFDKPRASIQVKATVYGAKGEVLLQKTVYCGNSLSDEQLSTMPLAELDKRISNPFGDSLANLAVQPGKGIPFVAVLANVPAGAVDFGVEAAGSTVSSK